MTSLRGSAAGQANPDEPTQSAATPVTPIQFARRAGFRFAVVYLLLHVLPFPLDHLPIVGSLSRFYFTPWSALASWAGVHVFHLAPGEPLDGSGDDTYGWVLVACWLFTALVVAIGWTIAEPRGKYDDRIAASARVYLRYYLASMMLTYGIAKVVGNQFPAPEPEYLTTPLGQLTPMNLLWNMMGYSAAYSFFAGALEVLGGALLLFRRTTTLGALLTLGVMTNVFMLDACYDVSVKQLALHLVLVALFLFAHDLERLACVLVLNRAAPPARERTPFSRREIEIGLRVAKVVVVGAFLWQQLAREEQLKAMDAEVPPAILPVGFYDVEGYTRNGEEVSWLLPARWRRVIISRYQSFTIQRVDATNEYLMIQKGKEDGSLTLKQQRRMHQRGDAFQVKVDRPDADHLLIAGHFGEEDLAIRLRKTDPPAFPLLKRGFHWATDGDYQ